MRFVCEQCQTRYTIPDEKARGRALKVRCKKCNGIIVIRPEAAAAAEQAFSDADATAIASPEAVRKLQETLRASATAPGLAAFDEEAPTGTQGTPARPDVEWYAIVNGVQQGPMDQKALVAKITSGALKHRHYVWAEQLPEWKRLEDVPELAIWLADPTDRAIPVRPPTVPDRKSPARAPKKEVAPSADLDSVFDDVSMEGPAQPAAAAEVDPFASVPDSPDLVRPEVGEMTRFVIAQSGIEKQKSPWRIATFIGGAVALVAALLVALSKLGVNLPLVRHAGGSSDKVFASVSGDQSLRDKLLGGRKPIAARPSSGSAGVAPHPVRETGPLAHKEAQHVDQLDTTERERLKALYAKSGDPSVKVARQTPVAAVDRPDAPLTPQQVSSTVAKYQSGYGRCVDQELKRNPGFRGGKVRVVTTIMSSGLVRQAEIQSDDGALARRLNASQLGGCLIDQTRRMVFPNFAGDPFDAEIPLVLGASM